MNASRHQIYLFTLALCAFWALSGNAQTNAAPKSDEPTEVPAPKKLLEKVTKQIEPVKGAVYVLPIQDEIGQPMVYIVRRGIKEAIANDACAVVLDMNTPGGRVDAVLEIMDLIEKFDGETYTYVNQEAYSGGAFISAATKHIYMAPGSVIGAAAPIAISPGGGAEGMPDTMEVKITSAIAAKIRAAAQRNGHNAEVFEAMVNKNKGLTINGEVIIKEGDILTLTNLEAEKMYGDPPKPLLSDGTIDTLEHLYEKIGLADREIVRIEPTGAEQLAQYITKLAPILLLLGILGIYIEVKLQTFGVIGVLAILCFLIYFFGHYVAAISGLEWLLIFAVGVILIVVELFFFPGTGILGILGALFIIVSLIMAMVDRMPDAPVMPTFPQLEIPLMKFGVACAGAIVAAMLIGKFLPRSRLFEMFVLQTASGGTTRVPMPTGDPSSLVGATGKSISPLRPAGKAMIGDQLMDVVTEGDHIPSDTPIKVVAVEGVRVVVTRA